MKNPLFKYIEHSLYSQSIVIIPNLGGFIVNIVSHEFDLNIEPPKFKIVFNPDLNHDDGFLTSSIMKDEKVTYKDASKRIKDLVYDIKTVLQKGDRVAFHFGSLFLDNEDNIVFQESKEFILPSYYGLSPIGLNYLTDLKKDSEKEKKRLLLRNSFGAIAAVGLGFYLFVFPSTSINDRATLQSAGFEDLLTNPISSPVESKVLLDTTSLINETPISRRTYYVIVGGEESPSRAEKLLDKVQSAGFGEADIVETNGRYRIYVAAFADKIEGESFLKTFRNENPEYSSAWLYSKRNK